MRTIKHYPIDDVAWWKRQVLHWAAAQEPVLYLDSNAHQEDWQCLVAVGAISELVQPAGGAFAALAARHRACGDWLFGLLGYDLKNETERLESAHFDGTGWPDMVFFQPKIVLGIRHGRLELHVMPGEDADECFCQIKNANSLPVEAVSALGYDLMPRMSKSAYTDKVARIRRHIEEGDLYEMNLCQEFFVEQAQLDPLVTFERLNEIAQSPFAAYLRWEGRYLLSASPERYLRKQGSSVLSQPIKGTRRRSRDPQEDAMIRAELAGNAKDRAEHVMIVDLVRNDLARHCQPGSVRVDDLFSIHSFPTVHQMISTVRGDLIRSDDPVSVLRDAFPPGSMTGAPKVMAMQLIEQYEETRRGLYSGAIGYVTPHGDFDFNVVIRSILYHASARYISVSVGGAIVFDSDPEQEYLECLVKLNAMAQALGRNGPQ